MRGHADPDLDAPTHQPGNMIVLDTSLATAAMAPENARAAWLTLALDVYRSHDRIFSAPVPAGTAFTKALRRLRAGLSALRQMAENPYLQPREQAYVEDLIRRIERWC
jgi:predicted nucleic acid-binding protein